MHALYTGRELESKALNSALEMESFKCVDDHTIFDSCKAKLNKDYQNTRKEVCTIQLFDNLLYYKYLTFNQIII